jgi:hypothetical protein
VHALPFPAAAPHSPWPGMARKRGCCFTASSEPMSLLSLGQASDLDSSFRRRGEPQAHGRLAP